MRPVRWAAMAALWLALTAHAADDHAPRSPAQQQLLERAASSLARGDAAAALRDYEAAATQEHALDIELGIARSLMRGGEYRRALTVAAHSAGAHGDNVQGALLYARLLELGGQAQAARRVLDTAAVRVPDSAALALAHREVASGETVAFERLPAGWRLVGAATLIDAGRQALVPLQAIDRASTVGLRDGLGRVSRAQVVERDESLRIAQVRLDQPFDGAPRLQRPPREPFPGAPVYVATAACNAGGSQPCAVWPRLQLGFLGMFDAASASHALGNELDGEAPGGPVFDARGRWVGVALRRESTRLLGSAVLHNRFGLNDEIDAGPSVTQPLTPDAIYEAALRLSLQAFSIRGGD